MSGLLPLAAEATTENPGSLVWVLGAAAAAAILSRVHHHLVLPTVVLEIVIGILIGPEVFDRADVTENITFLSNLGLVMLFFFAGLEVVEHRVPRRSIANGTTGWAISLVLGARASDPGERRRRGPPDAEQILERYRERLELDADQVAAIRPILVERIRATSAVFERVDPELDAIRRAGDDRVRAVLRPEQRPRLDALRADFESRRAEMRKRLKGDKQPSP